MAHVDDVMYFESDTKYTRVVALDCDGLIRSSLKELPTQLPEAFVQVHRKVVVNRHFIRGVHRIDDNVELELKNGGPPARQRVQPPPVQGDVTGARAFRPTQP